MWKKEQKGEKKRKKEKEGKRRRKTKRERRRKKEKKEERKRDKEGERKSWKVKMKITANSIFKRLNKLVSWCKHFFDQPLVFDQVVFDELWYSCERKKCRILL